MTIIGLTFKCCVLFLFSGLGPGFSEDSELPVDFDQMALHPGWAHSVSQGFFKKDRKGERPSLSAEVIKKLPEAICRLPSAQEECRIARSIPITGGVLPSGMIAVRITGKIVLSASILSNTCGLLIARGISWDQVAAIVATQYAPVMVHELHHETLARQMPGSDYLLNGELSAFARQLAAYHDLRANDGGVLSHSTALTNFYEQLWDIWRVEDGPENLKGWIKMGYILNPKPMADELGDMLGSKSSVVENLHIRLDRMLHMLENYKELMAKGLSTEILDSSLEYSTHGLNNRRELEAHINELNADIEAWSDDTKLAQMQKFYQEDYCNIWRLWFQHFPQRSGKRPFEISDRCWSRLSAIPPN